MAPPVWHAPGAGAGARLGSWLALVALVGAACSVLPSPPPPPTPAGRLLLIQAEPTPAGTLPGWSLHAIDRDTLLDSPETPPFSGDPCSTTPVLDRQQRLGAVLDNGIILNGLPCSASSEVRLHVLDLAAWAQGPAVDLVPPADRTLELAWTPTAGPPLVWSADSRRLYVFTVSRVRYWAATGRSPDETRQVWIVDPSGANPPQAVDLDVAVWRASLAPSGAALDVLGYRTRGPARYGTFQPGSTVLVRLDPTSGAVRARVPLPGVRLLNVGEAPASPLPGLYDPGVAASPNGRYYVVAHADEPVLDVVDVFAPGLERLERSIATEPGLSPGLANAAWVAFSPDSRRVYVRRQRWTQDGFAGLPLQVIEVGRWAARTFDPGAASLVFGPNDGRVYLIDPGSGGPGPVGAPSNAWDAPGSGLRVLDAAGAATTLLRGQYPLQVVPVGPDRLYVVLPGADWRAPGPPADLVAYDVGTWREVARRSWHAPLGLLSRP